MYKVDVAAAGLTNIAPENTSIVMPPSPGGASSALRGQIAPVKSATISTAMAALLSVAIFVTPIPRYFVTVVARFAKLGILDAVTTDRPNESARIVRIKFHERIAHRIAYRLSGFVAGDCRIAVAHPTPKELGCACVVVPPRQRDTLPHAQYLAQLNGTRHARGGHDTIKLGICVGSTDEEKRGKESCEESHCRSTL
jgi:hypothetical protein